MKENFRVYTLPLWYVLREHTKAELLEICRTQGIRKVSKLKKDELVATMVADLPLMVAEKMIYWDQPTYDLMEYIVMEDSFYPCDPDAPGNVEAYFLEESIGFTFEIETEGQWFNTLIVPKDFQHVFLLLLGNEEYQEDIKVNTKILRLAKGLLHYYGVLTPEELARFLNNLLDKPLDAHEIATVVAEMGSYTWGINWDGDQFSDGQMLNLPYVLNERENYRDLEHRQLTHDKIWQAGEPGFSQLTPEMQALADFIWGTKPKEGKAELIDALFGILQSNLQPTEILPGMVKFLELESKREVSKLALLLFDYYNNIPLWILKGHTPAQLGQHSIDDAQTSVAKKKVGRNDPCPCESGRKFKRCCGKN